MRKVALDVRKFAIPCPRVGSIESHSGYGATPNSGQEIHQIIQLRRVEQVPGYVPEKKLSISFDRKPYTFVVGGRADGVVEGAEPMIEEIKTTFDIDELYRKLKDEPNHPYVWQARTYGYIQFKQTGQMPVVKLHLVSSRNFKALDLEVELDILAYEEWLNLRLNELVEETKIKEKLFKKRQKMAEEMQFPFESPRPGQRELIDCIAENFAEGRALLLQAPTGLGKTAGVLFPALKDALSRGQKVVYVTPKNSQHQVAEEAVDLLNEKGSKVRALTLTAKTKMCLKTEVLCNPQYCEFARDYYKKVHDNDLINKVGKLRSLSSRKLRALGEEFEVCPFELSVEAIERADVVIGDYNYAFAPRGLIGRLSEPLLKISEKANVVIDEAHNLPSRAQDYFSPSLSTNQLNLLDDGFHKIDVRFNVRGRALIAEAKGLIQSYAVGGPRRIEINPEPFIALEKKIRDFTQDYLESDAEIQPQDPVLKLSNTWSDFVAATIYVSPAFFQTYQKNYFGEVLKITCCDASWHLREVYKLFKNVAAFSATLKPFDYYQSLMGFSPDKTKALEFTSPFPKANRKLMIIPQISTKLNSRSTSAPKIAEVIHRVAGVKPGNYIALFPSFDFVQLVRQHINLPDYQILQQSREMKATTIQSYLNELKTSAKPTLLLGVQGGVFSEGVDYVGNMLIGAFIVGPALPSFDFEREQVKIYYDSQYGIENGFDYTYVYPAMAKAVQSAGRVIRSEKDHGIIVLMDPRFLQNSYAQSMPEGWFENSPQELVSQSIVQDVQNFWEGRE
ncbi:MAG: ATP-dependent DNA helicase [Bdellovibrionaceae bacterium]|nr:ATP-dependent DNA helicase [Pseudobdellovibrionaceae bacterium]